MITVSETAGFDDMSQIPSLPSAEAIKAGAQALLNAFQGNVMVQDSNGTPVAGALVGLVALQGLIPVPLAQATTGADGQAAFVTDVKGVPDAALSYLVSPPGDKKVNVSVSAKRNMTVVAKMKNWTIPIAAGGAATPKMTNMLPWVIGGAAVLVGGWFLYTSRK